MSHVTIHGNQHTEEYIQCAICKQKYVWLHAHKINHHGHPIYVAICHNCKNKPAP